MLLVGSIILGLGAILLLGPFGIFAVIFIAIIYYAAKGGGEIEKEQKRKDEYLKEISQDSYGNSPSFHNEIEIEDKNNEIGMEIEDGNWKYGETEIDIQGTKIYTAISISKEETFALYIRDKAGIIEVFISALYDIPFMFRKINECKIKFDNEYAIETIEVLKSEDGKVIFFRKPKEIISRIKKAKQMTIEIIIENEASILKKFDIKGLKWECYDDKAIKRNDWLL